MNATVLPEVRIAQAGLISLVLGSILYGSMAYFIRKMQKQIVIGQKEKV